MRECVQAGFLDGDRVTPGSGKCKCRPDCEMPCWQRIPRGATVTLIDFPAPLDDGNIVWLRLPLNGLSTREADRLGAMLQALVVTPSCRTCWHRMSYDRQRGQWRCHNRHSEEAA